MEFEQFVKNLTPEVYFNLRSAVELGYFPDGRPVTKEMRQNCIQAIIYYEDVHNIPAEERVGYMEDKCKSAQKKEQEAPTHKGYELKL
ncbi:MAG: DUF1315 family protein [Venatoribacter sp.]